jgi:hypothetical protein
MYASLLPSAFVAAIKSQDPSGVTRYVPSVTALDC